MFFCVNLDPPIKQGQTRYHYLVFSFMQDEDTELELPFTEEELKEKYEGKLEKEMKGPTFQLVSKVMKALVNRKITVPGAFMGHSGTPAVSCSYKAASGFIYPLERGIMFVYKPPIFIKFEDVNTVNFARSGGTNRSFDIEVNTRGDTVYTFSSIEKDEYGRLYEFLKSKKINVKSVGKMDASKLDLSTDNIDHHAELVKANAASESDDSNKSMSSDDEDFNPDKLEAKDAKEEYDSDPSDTGSETDGEGAADGSENEEKKAAKAEKKAKKAAAKATSKPRKERGESGKKSKKLTKLPGQPKRPMSAYFQWLNGEGREQIKVCSLCFLV
jgi:structure-specific recognition protein 1